MFEVWLQMSDTNIDTENPSNLPALLTSIDALHVDLLKLVTINAQGIACYVNMDSQACKGPGRGVLLSEFMGGPIRLTEMKGHEKQLLWLP